MSPGMVRDMEQPDTSSSHVIVMYSPLHPENNYTFAVSIWDHVSKRYLDLYSHDDQFDEGTWESLVDTYEDFIVVDVITRDEIQPLLDAL